MTVYRDNIHGAIELDEYARMIINTPHFTRLRHLSQLGALHYVYSSATHSRYEHSIGVYYLTRLLLNEIHSKSGGHTRMRQLVCIAALCHDLGHGPFSHLFDSLLKEKYPNAGMHEQRSCVLLIDLLNHVCETHPDKYAEHLNLSPSEISIICSLILGDMPKDPEFQSCEYLYSIVSNPVCGIDTDRLDYILRDSKALGIGVTINPIELLKAVKLRGIRPKDRDRSADQTRPRQVICYPTRLSFEISQIFHTRYSLFKMAYNSPAVLAVDAMLKDILSLAADEGLFDIQQLITDPLAIKSMDDRVIYHIKRSLQDTPKDQYSRLKELIYRLESNDFYEVIFTYSFPVGSHVHPLNDPGHKWSEKIEFLRHLFSTITKDESIWNYIGIDVSELHYGKHAANPTVYVPYYNGDVLDITDELMRVLFPLSSQPFACTSSSSNSNVNSGTRTDVDVDIDVDTNANANTGGCSMQQGQERTDSCLEADADRNPIEQNFSVDQLTQDIIDEAVLDVSKTPSYANKTNMLTCPLYGITGRSLIKSQSSPSTARDRSVNSLIADYVEKMRARGANDGLTPLEFSIKKSNVHATHGMLSMENFQETMITIYVKPSKYAKDFNAVVEKYIRHIKTVFTRYMRLYDVRFNLLTAMPGNYNTILMDLQPGADGNCSKGASDTAGTIIQSKKLLTPMPTKDTVSHPFTPDSSLQEDSSDRNHEITEPVIKIGQ